MSNYPAKRYAAYRAMETIKRYGPMTVDEGIAHHRKLGPTRSDTQYVYDRCVKHGWLEIVNGKYQLTPKFDQWMDTQQYVEPTKLDNVTPPRLINNFGTTLSPKNIPSPLGTREGSNDFRNWASKYA